VKKILITTLAVCAVSLFAERALASTHEYDTCTGKSDCSGKCEYSDSNGDSDHAGNCNDTATMVALVHKHLQSPL